MMNSETVLVDTSTLFSGLGWFGPPYNILLRIANSDSQLAVTDYILDELFDHLSDFPTDRKESALRSLEHLHDATVIPEADWRPLLTTAIDEVGEAKDAPIMAAYLLDEVDVLVTSNTSDFPLADYETILTPREFLDANDSTPRY